MKTVYMSGYLEYNKGNGPYLEEGFFLQKPFSRDTLVRKVDEALGHGQSGTVEQLGRSSRDRAE
jgi:hypothetical protein